jgi:plastocyanin
MRQKLRYAFIALLLAGCAAPKQSATADPTPPTTAPAAVEVRIDNFTFSPGTVTISPGTSIKWTNHDDVPHTATSTTKVFNSPTLDTDDTFTFTFTRPGTYPYFCAVHPHMTGTVIVK